MDKLGNLRFKAILLRSFERVSGDVCLYGRRGANAFHCESINYRRHFLKPKNHNFHANTHSSDPGTDQLHQAGC